MRKHIRLHCIITHVHDWYTARRAYVFVMHLYACVHMCKYIRHVYVRTSCLCVCVCVSRLFASRLALQNSLRPRGDSGMSLKHISLRPRGEQNGSGARQSPLALQNRASGHQILEVFHVRNRELCFSIHSVTKRALNANLGERAAPSGSPGFIIALAISADAFGKASEQPSRHGRCVVLGAVCRRVRQASKDAAYCPPPLLLLPLPRNGILP